MKISKNLILPFKLQIDTLEFLQKHIFFKIPKEFKTIMHLEEGQL